MVLLKEAPPEISAKWSDTRDVALCDEVLSPKEPLFSFRQYALDQQNPHPTPACDAELRVFSESLTKWIRTLDLEDQIALETAALHGQVWLVKVEPEALKRWSEDQALYFREEDLKPNRLSNITTPLRPDMVSDGPVLLVDLPGGKRVVPNGNHRICQALAAGDSPLYAMELAGPDVFLYAFGMELKMRFVPEMGGLSWGKVSLEISQPASVRS